MKILFIGDLNGYTHSFHRYIALMDLEYDVYGISHVPVGSYAGITDMKVSGEVEIVGIILRKLGYHTDSIRANNRIIDFARKMSFDYIWVEKFLALKPKIIAEVRKKQPQSKIIFYSDDDMFARHCRSRYFLAGLPMYDCVFTTKSYNVDNKELLSLGAKKVVFVDKSYDTNFNKPVNLTNEDRNTYGANVGFVGSYEQDRADKMLFLAKNGIEVRVWGNGWSRLVHLHPNLKIENSPLYQLDYSKAISATKINLCFLRKKSRDLQTSRTMEIPACAGFMLAERTSEHSRLFEEGREAAFFNIEDTQELLEKVRYYLSHDAEREAMAKAGRERCINSGYSHHDRLRYMLSCV